MQVLLNANGAMDANAWYDAIKLEASTVVTPWTPGFLGKAVALDAGGMSVDEARRDLPMRDRATSAELGPSCGPPRRLHRYERAPPARC